MEQNKEIMQMLDLMVCPAFCVKDGAVIAVNAAAAQQLLTVGTPVADILVTGQQEYSDFEGGCLYLTVNIANAHCGASVKRVGDLDIFVTEHDTAQAELQALALAARELRTPLANTMSSADSLFSMPLLSENEEAAEYAAFINRSIYRMHRIILNMSDAYLYTQNEAANMEIRDIGSLLEEQFRQSAEVFASVGVALHFTPLRETAYGLVDAEKLERAVSNILSNAGKFMPDGGTIDAKLTRKGTMLYLTVHDSGSGIADNVMSSVYHRYLRQPGIEEGRQGIGLGMVLIRSAAAIHGGTVLIEKTAETGTRLTMTIPIRQDTSLVRSPVPHVDYAGELDHRLLELSESLPPQLYRTDKN